MILIVDDDAAIRSSLGFLLKKAGYGIEMAASPQQALTYIRSHKPGLVLLDMNFSLTTTGEEGLVLLKQIKIFYPEVPVILMTAWGSIRLAVQGMRAGAFDFITKPWNNTLLLQRIETALKLSSIPAGAVAGSGEAAFDRNHIIGKSPVLSEILETIKRIAPTNASVLITGESGTGKELLAQAIHINSHRKHKPFVKVNLGGISQSLFESEMFGHRKGAFTDAVTDRTGRFELADKGTIFLDEIGDLDMSCQVKLLRVLQDQTFERLGDSKPIKTDVRIVSATNANLRENVKERTFREDLFYRINLITLHLPPLRERREDIPLLTHFFAGKQTVVNHLPPVEIASDALSFLSSLPYPGNIRELKNLVERTMLISNKRILTAEDFRKNVTNFSGEMIIPAASLPAGLTLDEMEKQAILMSLERHGHTISRVAVELGLSRAALYRRMEKYGIPNRDN